ncbi:MAG: hypothetical protein NVS2B16_26850 [Chloroflexota bacterium]
MTTRLDLTVTGIGSSPTLSGMPPRTWDEMITRIGSMPRPITDTSTVCPALSSQRCSTAMTTVTILVAATTDLIPTIRRLRKSLRDVRDRAARFTPAWAAVEMAGLFNGNHLVLLIRHNGIARDALWTALERRWPEVVAAEISRDGHEAHVRAAEPLQKAPPPSPDCCRTDPPCHRYSGH